MDFVAADRPFQERTAAVQDTLGNVWDLARYTGEAPTSPHST